MIETTSSRDDVNDFMLRYNELLSDASHELRDKFPALASPTLSKQETITFLYQDVLRQINGVRINTGLLKLRLQFIPRLLFTLYALVTNSILFRINSLPGRCTYIRTWLVPRSIKLGKLRDDYFDRLIDDLSLKTSIVVGFQPLNYGKIIQRFMKAKKPKNYINPIGLLTIEDICRVFVSYIKTANINLKNKYYFRRFDITNTINYSLQKDYYKLRSFQAYLELAIAAKIKAYNPKLFLYVYENQAWEKSYILELKNKNTKIIGYQSSGFSYRFLNYFPSSTGNNLSLFPDRILTVGDQYTKVLKELGHYDTIIETFAALRFNYPSHNSEYIIKESSSQMHMRILYAFSVHSYQYDKILAELIDVFGNSDIEVHLKYHPLYNNKKYSTMTPSNINRVYHIDMNSLRDEYDIVLFNDNSFGIESLLMGVKSYEYQFGEQYPEDRLLNFKSYNYKVDRDGLIRLRHDISKGSHNKKLDEKYIKKYINFMYKVYDGNVDNLLN
jgi:hypothetical protein